MSAIVLAALLAALVLVVLALQTRSPEDDDDEIDETGGRLARIRAQLDRLGSQDPNEVREATNRLLAMGPGVLDTLCDWLKRIDEPGEARAHQAVVEELIAGFGVNAVPALGRALRRVVFPSPMVASALRVIGRVGAPAVASLAGTLDADNSVALGMVLHRCPGVPAPHVVQALDRLEERRLQRTLQVFGGVLDRHPAALLAMFDRARPRQRRGLVEFYVRWPAPLAAAVLVRALHDPDPTLRTRAALGTALLVASPPALLAEAIDDAAPEVRRAALVSLQALDASDLGEVVARRTATGPPEERAEAALLLAGLDTPGRVEALRQAAEGDDEAPRMAARAALHAVTGEGGGPADALAALDRGDEALRRVAARCVALHVPGDARALERTILLADADDGVTRAAACAALAESGLRELPPLLSRAVQRCQDHPEEHFYLRLASLRAGDAVVPQLLRLVRTGRPVPATLAAELTAATGTDEALEGLLRSLPHRRGTGLGMVIRSHAAAFGPRAVERALGLLRTDVGLLPQSATEFVLQYGDASVLEPLLDRLGHSDSDRTAVLAALEAFAATDGPAVLAALDRRRGRPEAGLLRRQLGMT